MIKRTFHKGCEWCGATGYVSHPGHTASIGTVPCPVCKGAGVIQVVEEDYTEVRFNICGEVPETIFWKSV